MINQTYRRYVFGILLSVPDYIVPVIRQGVEDGSIHTDCPEELADLMMLLTDVWANPIIFPMSEEQMVILDFSTALLVLFILCLLEKMDVVALIFTALFILYGIQGAYQPAVQASIPALLSNEHI